MIEFTKKELQQIKNLRKNIEEYDVKINLLKNKRDEAKNKLKIIEEQKILRYINENNIEFEELKNIVSIRSNTEQKEIKRDSIIEENKEDKTIDYLSDDNPLI